LTPNDGNTPQIRDLKAHSIVFTIEKDSATTLKVDFAFDGGGKDKSLTSGGGTTTLVTTFNEVGFCNGSAGTGFVIDNVKVEFIPKKTQGQ
jgi:hypothetical protein